MTDKYLLRVLINGCKAYVEEAIRAPMEGFPKWWCEGCEAASVHRLKMRHRTGCTVGIAAHALLTVEKNGIKFRLRNGHAEY